jgi:hypothetical protein
MHFGAVLHPFVAVHWIVRVSVNMRKAHVLDYAESWSKDVDSAPDAAATVEERSCRSGQNHDVYNNMIEVYIIHSADIPTVNGQGKVSQQKWGHDQYH